MLKTRLTIPARFPLGRIVYTCGAIANCDNFFRIRCLLRHASGDWGNVDKVDRNVNDAAVIMGLHIRSVYPIDRAQPCTGNNALWIVTEGDRRVTTFHLATE